MVSAFLCGVKPMTDQPRRRHPRSIDSPFSDEILTALTRGFYVPPSKDTRPKCRETYEPGDTFEETYPKYSFSILVRIALKLADWISRRRSAEERPDGLGGSISRLHR